MVYDAGGKLAAEYAQVSPPTTGKIEYVTNNYQGSTSVVTDNGGAVTSRHDYLPFGEEIGASVGSRTTAKAFSQGDMMRQKYAGMETDAATGMAHTLWRKQDNWSGRWTSPDPYGGSMTTADPQSFNRYTYCDNDPVNKTDALGLMSGADASQSWGDVAGTFWGTSDDQLFRRDQSCGMTVFAMPELPLPTLQYPCGGFGGGPQMYLSAGTSQGKKHQKKSGGKAKQGKQKRKGKQKANQTSASATAPAPPPAAPSTTCDQLANDLQTIANKVQEETAESPAAWQLQQFNITAGKWTYGTYVAEGPLGAIDSPQSQSSVSKTPSYNWGQTPHHGQSGFAPQFWEGSDPALDQVHHFGVYFSGGIAGHNFELNLHRSIDNNAGDTNLGRQSQLLGRFLRNNPGQLSNVGSLVRSTICLGEPIPR